MDYFVQKQSYSTALHLTPGLGKGLQRYEKISLPKLSLLIWVFFIHKKLTKRNFFLNGP